MTASKIVAAAASGVGGKGLDVDDVFKTYVYQGDGSARGIVNNIDLLGEGGLVWTKRRDDNTDHHLIDTERGATKRLRSNEASSEGTNANSITSFENDGYNLGSDSWWNYNTGDFVSWTWRKSKKFFDIVTYTGDGTSNRAVPHGLDCIPGMIIIKAYANVGGANNQWAVMHNAGSANLTSAVHGLCLNRQDGNAFGSYADFSSHVTSTTFNPYEIRDTGYERQNINGVNYVAYLFAHNTGDGIFGPNEDQDIIKCGKYVGDSGSQQINIGFEPSWILIKNMTSNNTDWSIFDTTRYWQNPAAGGDSKHLKPNDSLAESGIARFYPTATGFGFTTENGTHMNVASDNYIYVAIRKGSLFEPEAATEVFDIDTMTGTSGNQGGFRSTFRVDLALNRDNINDSDYIRSSARLTGTRRLTTSANDAESNQSAYEYDYMTGWYNQSGADSDYYSWMWQRAPKFCDVVAWAGSGSSQALAHNLEIPPEMIWVKKRNTADSWAVYHSGLGNTKYLTLNNNDAAYTSANFWNNTSPTATHFTVGIDGQVNGVGYYVGYLFSTLAGISKVGSYTGDGQSGKQIDCGFTNGARFVLIKNATNQGNWLLWDSERGITAGADPYLLIDTTDAENSGDNVDPYSAGFIVNGAGNNINGATHIFYAIAN